MFYLNETYYRFIYLLIAILCNILTLYLHKVDIAFISIIPTLFVTNIIDYFIFTEPREIFFFYIYSCFTFFFFFFFLFLFFFFFILLFYYFIIFIFFFIFLLHFFFFIILYFFFFFNYLD